MSLRAPTRLQLTPPQAFFAGDSVSLLPVCCYGGKHAFPHHCMNRPVSLSVAATAFQRVMSPEFASIFPAKKIAGLDYSPGSQPFMHEDIFL